MDSRPVPDMAQPAFNRLLFRIFVMLMPFMSAMAPTEWTPLPLVMAICVAPVVLLCARGRLFKDVIASDMWFLAAWVLGCIAISNSPLGIGPKNINYVAAMIVAYGAFLVVIRSWLQQASISWRVLGDAAQMSLTVLSFAIVLEFITASFLGVFISDVLPFAHGDLTVANLVNESFKRPRGFSTEPGFTALAFECLWPLTFLSGRASRWRQVLFLVAFCLLASAAAIVSVSFAIVVVWLVRRRDAWGLVKGMAAVALLAVVFGMTETGTEIWQSAIGRKLDVATAQEAGGDDAVTVLDRVTTYATGLQLMAGSPFGIGWGTVGQSFADGSALPGVGTLSGSGMLSLYLDVVVAAGWAGLL